MSSRGFGFNSTIVSKDGKEIPNSEEITNSLDSDSYSYFGIANQGSGTAYWGGEGKVIGSPT